MSNDTNEMQAANGQNSTDPAPVSRDFGVLMLVGRINSFVGWLLIAVAVVVAIAAIGETNGASLFLILTVPFLLLVVASGQVISAFVSIERNTNETAEALQEIKGAIANLSNGS